LGRRPDGTLDKARKESTLLVVECGIVPEEKDFTRIRGRMPSRHARAKRRFQEWRGHGQSNAMTALERLRREEAYAQGGGTIGLASVFRVDLSACTRVEGGIEDVPKAQKIVEEKNLTAHGGAPAWRWRREFH
jgi:hypothetical protein